MADYLVRLQNLDKKNQLAVIEKAKIEQKLDQAKEELQKIEGEIVSNGLTVETLQKTIETLDIEIENTLDENEAKFA